MSGIQESLVNDGLIAVQLPPRMYSSGVTETLYPLNNISPVCAFYQDFGSTSYRHPSISQVVLWRCLEFWEIATGVLQKEGSMDK